MPVPTDTDEGRAAEQPVDPGASLRRPAIDPRIRARRVAVRRDEGRRRLRITVSALSVVGVVVVGFLATRSPVLDVDRVEVTGARRTPLEDIRTAAGIADGDAMTDVDEGDAARRVRALPWVASAVVRRSWPGSVSITVTERRPAASTRVRAGGWALVDRAGRILAEVPLPAEDVPALEGVPPSGGPGSTVDATVRPVLTVAAAIPPERAGLVRVVALLPGDAGVELRLATPDRTPAGVVRLGPPHDLDAKLLAAFTVLDRVDTRRLAVLDVRVPSAPVITRAEAPARATGDDDA